MLHAVQQCHMTLCNCQRKDSPPAAVSLVDKENASLGVRRLPPLHIARVAAVHRQHAGRPCEAAAGGPAALLCCRRLAPPRI